MTDRTRRRRLKSTLFSKGAWQQVPRIEHLCHTHVSHMWFYHLDACAGSLLTPNDYVTTTSPTCSKDLAHTAETFLGHPGHDACVQAVLGGLKLEGASPRNPEDSQKRNPGPLISFLPLLSQDAAAARGVPTTRTTAGVVDQNSAVYYDAVGANLQTDVSILWRTADKVLKHQRKVQNHEPVARFHS